MPSSLERRRLMRIRDRSIGITEVLLRVPKRDAQELRKLARKRLDAYKAEKDIA